MSEKFYVTTPIYYVNDVPHIGHAYTTVAADVLARYNRLLGKKTYFLTGTDEHGMKIERAAKANNELPIQLADRVVERSLSLWKLLNITNDDFIRTTQERHERVVQYVFEKLHEQGDIYLGAYSGWYCASCENFLAEADLKNGSCPDCGKKAEMSSEPTYFFKMSKYGERLLKHLDENPEFVRPEARFNETRSRVKEGLNDLSVTRTSLQWAVPLPFDPKHRAYVWVDALTNYISALGYPDGDLFKEYWPADVHLIGKDIIWFHAVIWPCLLMALGLPLPKKIYAHGWWTNSGEKMSKSRGNFVDPIDISNKYGVDPFRYFLLREIPFGMDGDFSERAIVSRFNNDLGNDLGNLLHRTLTMIEKYFGGEVPAPTGANAEADELKALSAQTVREVDELFGQIQFSRALESIWRFISAANKLVESSKPWVLAKDPSKRDELATVLYSLAETLRIASALLWPVMPEKCDGIRGQLGACSITAPLAEQTTWGTMKPGTRIAKGEPLFPKILE